MSSITPEGGAPDPITNYTTSSARAQKTCRRGEVILYYSCALVTGVETIRPPRSAFALMECLLSVC